MSRWLSIPLVMSALALLSCNEDAKPVVSLEEAKQITTEMRGQGFTPPPRTIDDITAILNQQKPDPAKVAANKAAADVVPPAGAQPAALSRFYFQRAIAAAELGRTIQRVQDLRQAVAFGRQAGTDTSRIMQDLAAAELDTGNGAAAVQAVRDWRSALPPGSNAGKGGQNLAVIVAAAIASVGVGDLDFASDYAIRADELFNTFEKKLRDWQILADTQRTLPSFGGGSDWMYSWSIYRESYRADVLTARGLTAEAEGRLTDAENALREAIADRAIALSKYWAIAKASTSPEPQAFYESKQTRLMLDLARVLLEQGKLLQAEAEAREALLLLLRRRGRYAPETAAAVTALGQIKVEEGRPEDAEKLGVAAVDIYEEVGAGAGAWPLAVARNLVAEAQAAQNKWTDADATFQKLRQVLGDDTTGRARFIESNLTAALVDIKVHRPAEAMPILQRVMEARVAAFGETSSQALEARGLLGVALAASGQRDAGQREFEAATSAIFDASRTGGGGVRVSEESRQRRRLILESYIGLLADVRGTPQAATADVGAKTFRLADAARGSSLQKAVAASTARSFAKDAGLADLVRREQDSEQQATALQAALVSVLASPPDQQDQAAVARLRAQIGSLILARGTISDEIARRFPDYANLINPPPATVAQVQKSLHPGEALIATYVGEEKTFVWAVPASGPAAFAAAPLGHDQVKAMVKSLRKSLDPSGLANYSDVRPYDVNTAHELYAGLLKPVEPGWKGAKKLIVVAEGPLGPLPFDVLVTEPYQVPAVKPGESLFWNYRDVPWLARQVAITWLPSVTSLAALRSIPAPPETRRAFVGFGDPWFTQRQAEQAQRDAAIVTASAEATTRGLQLLQRSGPADSLRGGTVLPRLPDTANEVRAIGAALGADPDQDIFLGARASERRVETMDLSNRKVVLFATHGLMAGQIDGLTEPALAMTSPAISGDGGDGLLSLSDIMALRLNADWVVLSACNTGAGDGAGAEAVSGLGRGFFYAGARALLVTHWPVETTSAQMETVELFRRQAADPKLTRAEALQQAKLAVIQAGLTDSTGRLAISYAHPMFWAPYALVGDPG